MPNVGHRWTDEEELNALSLDWEAFSQLHPNITRDAYRVRRRKFRLPKYGGGIARSKKRTACKVCAFLDTLQPADRADWEEDLRAPATGFGRVSHRAIEDSLKNAGVDVEESSVRRHRRNHIGK